MKWNRKIKSTEKEFGKGEDRMQGRPADKAKKARDSY